MGQVRTTAKVGVRSLVEEQRLLQVAPSGDFLGVAIWARRVALMAAFNPLALELMTSVRALGVCVEYCSLPHGSYSVCSSHLRAHGKLEKFGGPGNLRQGLSTLAPGKAWLH
jgi:hypothetical protein